LIEIFRREVGAKRLATKTYFRLAEHILARFAPVEAELGLIAMVVTIPRRSLGSAIG
jgi:hypothetical protein